jgi:hypothetical protein
MPRVRLFLFAALSCWIAIGFAQFSCNKGRSGKAATKAEPRHKPVS